VYTLFIISVYIRCVVTRTIIMK